MTQLDLMEWSQRWREQQASWCPRRRVVDTRQLEVEPITHDEARAFILTHHYSASYPAAVERFGLHLSGRLVGVAVYGMPAGLRVLESRTGYAFPDALELCRFVLLDEVDFNAESHFWSVAKGRLVHKRKLRALLAYSDPLPRESLDGQVILPGHYGQIYQATGAAYRGRATARWIYLDAAGRVVSGRTIQKIRKQEQGWEGALRQLLASGCPEREPGEELQAYVARALLTLRRVHHPGNHTYVWGLRRGVKYADLAERPRAIDVDTLLRQMR